MAVYPCGFFRDFVMGTTVALVVISSSAEVDPSFQDHLRTTVLGSSLLTYFLIKLVN